MKKYFFLSLLLAFVDWEMDSTPDLFTTMKQVVLMLGGYMPPIDTLTTDIYKEFVASYLESNNVEVLSFHVTYDSTVAQLCRACL